MFTMLFQPKFFMIEIKRFIQSAFASGSRLMGISRIHLIIYFLECIFRQVESYAYDPLCKLHGETQKTPFWLISWYAKG